MLIGDTAVPLFCAANDHRIELLIGKPQTSGSAYSSTHERTAAGGACVPKTGHRLLRLRQAEARKRQAHPLWSLPDQAVTDLLGCATLVASKLHGPGPAKAM